VAAVFPQKKPWKKKERFIALSPVLMVMSVTTNVAPAATAAD
jgi:hypothetical protein